MQLTKCCSVEKVTIVFVWTAPTLLVSLILKIFKASALGITPLPKIYTSSEEEYICLRYVIAWLISLPSDGTFCPDCSSLWIW